jgi:hypothetical protein
VVARPQPMRLRKPHPRARRRISACFRCDGSLSFLRTTRARRRISACFRCDEPLLLPRTRCDKPLLPSRNTLLTPPPKNRMLYRLL